MTRVYVNEKQLKGQRANMWKLPLLEARASVSGSLNTHIVVVFQDSEKKAIPREGLMRGG